jgi:hypothetical protein
VLSSFPFFLILSAFFMTACSIEGNGDSGLKPRPGSARAITAFGFEDPPVSGTINETNKTILIGVPAGTVLTNLVPAVTVSAGARVRPASGAGRNFNGPVRYTVAAEDGSTAVYTVTVREFLTSITAVETYLEGAAGGEPDQPVFLPVTIDLSDGGSWTDLLAAIQTAGKYVDLYLPACAGGTEFDPGAANTGESRIVSLVLPGTAAGITAGGSYSTPAFRNFSSLKSVSGAGIERIGEYAFTGCSALISVNFPAAARIGEYAFAVCTALALVNLPGAAYLGDYAFAGCTALTAVSLPAATDIGDEAFAGCTALTSVSLPSAADIGALAFRDCIALGQADLPAAARIGDCAFAGCTALSSVSLPAGLTHIGSNPFSECPNLTTITVASGNPSYRARNGILLNKAGTILIAYPSAAGTVILDNLITSAGPYAFGGCTALTSVSLPGAAYLGDYAFFSCIALTSVKLPAVPPGLGPDVFAATNFDIGAGTTLTIRTPAGAVDAYTAPAESGGWGVDAETGANGNTAVYGPDHKRIVISAAF